ncbi:N-acetyltransferase ESCO2 [Cylas formicarius]|uniref:N-acetyltransferase ESCO2 n=1 Tax=Cylas formicarius TaxID=197179 RepID=UPI002958797E|nr:N-acetyltransferase ESCO2 [Cylas formicarius]
MTTLKQSEPIISKHDYSPLILERRRSLFPTNNCDIDFELGHIQPLSSDSVSNSEDEERPHISDYDILGVMNKEGLKTPTTKEVSQEMSPLHLSQFTQAEGGTPKKFSPSQNLKTPHDSSSRTNWPKLQRSLLEQCKSSKRNISQLDSPVGEYFYRQEPRCEKVRTALFCSEPDMSLSTKTFYPKFEENVVDKLDTNRKQRTLKTVEVVTTKSSNQYKKRIGEINNGVRHKIRKPKQKKLNMANYTRATKKLLISGAADVKGYKTIQPTSNSSNKKLAVSRVDDCENLSVYLKELKNIENKTSLIEHAKPAQEVDGNKENISVEIKKRPLSPVEQLENTNRKFFKSAKKKRISVGNKEPNVDLIKTTSQSVNKTNHTTEIVNDFDLGNESEVVPKLDINNILSILSQQGPKEMEKLDNVDGIFTENADNFNNVQACNISDKNVPESIEYSHPNLGRTGLEQLTKDKNEASQLSKEFPSQKQPNTVTFTAHSSILASENSIHLHNHLADSLLSPISQMCDVTSGLALDSPKRGRNLTTILNGMSNARTDLFESSSMEQKVEQKKLYPIFYEKPNHNSSISMNNKKIKINEKPARKFKELPESQMLLDAGQKRFGYTLCSECNLVYHMGDPGEEIEHLNYHNSSQILRFAGWKNEHVIADYHKNGRIIRIVSSDSKVWLKKVKDLMQVVIRDLGCPDVNFDTTQSQVYLYIKNRTIAGCLVATVPKTGGHRMLSNSDSVALCSEETYPIKCGVSHIWVAPNIRKQGIARALMDAVKRSFIKNLVLTNNDIALTAPTEAGAAFATKYFNTSNYLIYYS